jgi:hypothetical protein
MSCLPLTVQKYSYLRINDGVIGSEIYAKPVESGFKRKSYREHLRVNTGIMRCRIGVQDVVAAATERQQAAVDFLQA